MTDYISEFIKKCEGPIDAQPVPAEVISKYKTILPAPIIELWEAHGFAGYSQGLYWTINPDEYLEFMHKWVNTEWEAMYPIMRTAFGDLIVIYCMEEDEDFDMVGFEAIDVRHQKAENITVGLEKIFKKYLPYIGRLMGAADINDTLYYYGIDDLGILKSDQCYGFDPILAQGGKAKEKFMKIFNYKEHLDLLTSAIREKVDI